MHQRSILDLPKYSTTSCVVPARNLPILLDDQLDGEGMKFLPYLTGISSPLEARYEGKSSGAWNYVSDARSSIACNSHIGAVPTEREMLALRRNRVFIRVNQHPAIQPANLIYQRHGTDSRSFSFCPSFTPYGVLPAYLSMVSAFSRTPCKADLEGVHAWETAAAC
jgi:hypothetical protein